MVGEEHPGNLAPPVAHASRFAIATSAADINVSFATMRQVINTKTGMPGEFGALEWFITVAMGPTAASHLCQALQHTLAEYEKKFGKIPQDPQFKIQTSGPDDEPKK